MAGTMLSQEREEHSRCLLWEHLLLGLLLGQLDWSMPVQCGLYIPRRGVKELVILPSPN